MQDLLFLLVALTGGVTTALIIFKAFETGYKLENRTKKDKDNSKVK